jgi:hypothetical protein
MEVAQLERKHWSTGSTAGTQGRLGSTVTELRLHRENSGERGSGEPEGLGVNRGVSRDANDKAELIEATGAARARRRP